MGKKVPTDYKAIPIGVMRRERKLLLRHVATLVGCDVSTLSRIERGTQLPRPDLAARLADFYGVPEAVVLYPSRYMAPKEPAAA